MGIDDSAHDFLLGLLRDPQDPERILVNVPRDALKDKVAQSLWRNRVYFDTAALKVSRAAIGLLGRPGKQVQCGNLLRRDGDSLELDISTELCEPTFNLCLDVEPAWVPVTEVVQVGRLALRLNSFRRFEEKGDAGLAARDHQPYVPLRGHLVQHARNGIFLGPDLNVGILV